MKKTQILLNKYKLTILSGSMRVIYIILLLILVLGVTNEQSLAVTKQIKNIFQVQEAGFEYLSGPKAFWQWTEKTLIPGLYAPTWYNGRLSTWRERLFVRDRQSFRLGPIRMRQLRIIPAGCPLVGPLHPLIVECNPEYSFATEDTKDYAPFWLANVENGSLWDTVWRNAFLYHTGSELNMLPIFGNMATYSGGGYIVHLPEEEADLQEFIQQLKHLDWLNLYTRAIFVEFSLYNPNANLFVNVALLFELPPAGGSLTMFFVESFRVYGTVGNEGTFTLVCGILYIILLFIYTVTVIRTLFLEKKKFFKRVINIMDITQVILSYVCVGIYITRLTIVRKALSQVFKAKGEFVNFYPLAVISQTFVIMMGIVLFINIIRLLSISYVSYRFRIVGWMLSKGATVLAASICQLLIFLFAFVSAFYSVYGSSKKEYSSFITCCEYLFSLFLGGGSSFKLKQADIDGFSQALLMLYTVIVAIVFTNFFISTILEIYVRGQNELRKLERNEHVDVIKYLDDTMKLFQERLRQMHSPFSRREFAK